MGQLIADFAYIGGPNDLFPPFLVPRVVHNVG